MWITFCRYFPQTVSLKFKGEGGARAAKRDAIGDDVIGDDATGDDAAGDDVIGDGATGDDATGDDVIGMFQDEEAIRAQHRQAKVRELETAIFKIQLRNFN